MQLKSPPQRHLLFPTQVMLFEFADTEALHAELREQLRSQPTADLLLLPTPPACLLKLQEMFIQGLELYLDAAGWTGDFSAQLKMWANLGEGFLPAHPHRVAMAGVYYIDVVGSHSLPRLVQGSREDFFRQDDGVLIFHDPRFNASLLDTRERHHAKLWPTPGLMVIFPGYLWHTVSPHDRTVARTAVAVNFSISPAEPPKPRPAIPLRIGRQRDS